MKPEQLASLTTVTRLVSTTAGIVVATSRPDPEADAYDERLSLFRGAELAGLTDARADRHPVVSPDGSRVAFLRRVDGISQVHVLDVESRVVTPLAPLPLGAEEIAWLPDGMSLVATARRPDPGRYGTDGVSAAAEAPRRITKANWRLNGVGTIFDRPRMIARLDADGGMRWLDVPRAEWSAPLVDAAGVLYAVAALHDGNDGDVRRDLHRIDVSDGGTSVAPITGTDRPVEVLTAAALADGRIVVAYRELGPLGRAYAGTNAGIGVVDPRDGRVQSLTDHENADIGAEGVLVVGADDDDMTHVYATARHRGTVALVSVGVPAPGGAGGAVQPVLSGDVRVTAHTRDGDRTVVAHATTGTPARISLIGPGGAASIVDCASLAAPVQPPREHVIGTRDGREVHGWSFVPAGSGPHPVILSVHGGPFAQHGPTLSEEVQVLVAAGFAVVMCNPRGSAGYGRVHARAVINALGTVDAADVIDFLDGVLATDGALDAGRVGIMGGSYGAFLSAWIAGHDDRFAGALLERGWFDPEMFLGTSDIGSFYTDAYMGPSAADRARVRPIDVADRIAAPVLLMHSADDLRCPIGQAESYVARRRRRALPVEFVVFPSGDHELSRSGRPRHRVQRLEIIVDWWRRVFDGPPAPARGSREEGWR